MKAHQNNSKDFEELSYSSQASAINAQLNNLEIQIKSNAKKAQTEGKENPIPKRIENLKNLITRLEQFNS